MEQNYKKLVDEKLQDALSHAVAAELQQERSMFGSEEEFCSWLEAQERQRRQNHRRLVKGGLAAAAVFVCLLFVLGSFFPPESVLPEGLQSLLGIEESIASPGPDGDVAEENGSIVIGGDGNGNLDTWTATFASYEDIPEQYQDQIIWFEEMPEGYELEKIIITVNNGQVEFSVHLSSKDEKVVDILQLYLEKNEESNTVLNLFDEAFYVGKRTVYYKITNDSSIYVILENNNLIYIIDRFNLQKEKIEGIITSIRTG